MAGGCAGTGAGVLREVVRLFDVRVHKLGSYDEFLRLSTFGMAQRHTLFVIRAPNPIEDELFGNTSAYLQATLQPDDVQHHIDRGCTT